MKALVTILVIIATLLMFGQHWWIYATGWVLGGPAVAEWIEGNSMQYPESSLTFLSLFTTLIGGPLLWVAMLWDHLNH